MPAQGQAGVAVILNHLAPGSHGAQGDSRLDMGRGRDAGMLSVILILPRGVVLRSWLVIIAGVCSRILLSCREQRQIEPAGRCLICRQLAN